MRGKVMAADTAAYSLKFGLTTIPAALRLGWLPMVLGLAGAYFLEVAGGETQMGFGAEADMEGSFGASASWGASMDFSEGIVDPVAFGIGLPMLIISAVMMVPLMVLWTRMAASQVKAPSGLFYFRWGGREWRTVGMFIFITFWFMILALISFGPAIGIEAFTGGINFDDNMSFQSDLGAPAGIALFIGCLFFVWAMIRSSLMIATTSIENRFAPFYAFGLTGGNFWKIFLACVLMVIAIALIFIPIGFGLVGVGALTFGLTGFDPATTAGLVGIIGFLLLSGLLDLYGNLVGFGYSGRLWQAITLADDYPLDEE
ncbi:MAG: hypothetical protein AAF986_01280 [Pseudomonadota bacterium]